MRSNRFTKRLKWRKRLHEEYARNYYGHKFFTPGNKGRHMIARRARPGQTLARSIKTS